MLSDSPTLYASAEASVLALTANPEFLSPSYLNLIFLSVIQFASYSASISFAFCGTSNTIFPVVNLPADNVALKAGSML